MATDIDIEIVGADGQPAANPPVAGLYELVPTLNDPEGLYDGYDISAAAGKLYVSPQVSCDDKIIARIVCKSPVSLPDHPEIKYMYRYQYTNPNEVPIHVPVGIYNRYLTAAYYIGEPPVVFEPGTHTFEVYVDDSFFLWKIRTPGCREFSLGHSGFFADLCEDAGALTANGSTFETSAASSPDKGMKDMNLFPNPAGAKAWISLPDLEGALQVEVFDAVGRRLSVQTWDAIPYDQLELDLTGYPAGLLLIKTTLGKESRTWRLIHE